MDEMAQAALNCVRNGEIKIRPDTAERSYFRWLENIQDWCLSRYATDTSPSITLLIEPKDNCGGGIKSLRIE